MLLIFQPFVSSPTNMGQPFTTVAKHRLTTLLQLFVSFPHRFCACYLCSQTIAKMENVIQAYTFYGPINWVSTAPYRSLARLRVPEDLKLCSHQLNLTWYDIRVIPSELTGSYLQIWSLFEFKSVQYEAQFGPGETRVNQQCSPCDNRGDMAFNFLWTGIVWEITGWSSRLRGQQQVRGYIFEGI